MLEYIHIDLSTNDHITILVGQNAKENWQLIDSSSQNDIWLHLGSGLPSPHVVIKVPENITISKSTIKYGAVLCKSHSSYKSISKVTVIYTNIKNVTKSQIVGSVTTKKIKKIVL